MFAGNVATQVRIVRRFDDHFDLRTLTQAAFADHLWFRRFIARDHLMPSPEVSAKPRPCAHEGRFIRQERSNIAQRRQILRRRFVQELAR